MQHLLNELLRIWVRVSLHFYFGQIRVKNRSLIPNNTPLIVVANHQNALLDALLIATELGLKPFFLARASAFKKPWIATLLQQLQIMPVFRMRDGISSLSRNEEIFQQCQNLLARRKTIVLFPEGNHSLKRHLRPLSKGFTRIAFSTLDRYPQLPLYILPIGINYGAHQLPWCKVNLLIGEPIDVSESKFDPHTLKEMVASSLRELTIQLPTKAYETSLEKHLKAQMDLSDPEAFRQRKSLSGQMHKDRHRLIQFLYFPLFFIWKWVKPGIHDPVFYGTVKFLIGFLGVPTYFFLISLICRMVGFIVLGPIIVIGLTLALYFFRNSGRQA
ncbi:1-acyl-sn-glycerol-3-phosphate acyltransferase [Lunatimonas salinarum]|uniref:1-acyl-sn-glycerol-3-phosphate acyltransferase n=1 Tax=Lunatimonas salinarum TaxID=1774590 RepID=UPI001ADF49CB|nr:1-acyl-sn-glycerol-3-phosphate acyltransferase [Lunatimonas salinarum]